MRAAILSTMAGVLIACGGPGATPSPDASGATDIAIPWTADPAVPGQVGSNAWVDRMTFRVDSLRVVGDTGTSESQDRFMLAWGSAGSPAPTVFANVPSGLYSKLLFRADGELVNYSWEIDGRVMLDGSPQPFAIHDLTDLDVEIDTSAMLDPGGSATIGVTFELGEAFFGLDFTQFDNDDGMLVLDTDDTQMQQFRAQLQQAIGPSIGSPSVN